jgi:hypothetical protein
MALDFYSTVYDNLDICGRIFHMKAKDQAEIREFFHFENMSLAKVTVGIG